jgi:hypothetical protein
MVRFLFIVLFGLQTYALDSAPGNFNGKYVITQAEACASYGILYSCVESDSLYGKHIEIIQSKASGEQIVCVNKSFKDGIKGDSSCYKNNPDNHITLSITSGGFKAEYTEYQFGEEFLRTYSKLSRSGTVYKLKDGGSTKGVHLYYNYTLEKINP